MAENRRSSIKSRTLSVRPSRRTLGAQIHVVLGVVAGQRALHSGVRLSGGDPDLDNGLRVVHGHGAARRRRPASLRNRPFCLGPHQLSVRAHRAREKAER